MVHRYSKREDEGGEGRSGGQHPYGATPMKFRRAARFNGLHQPTAERRRRLLRVDEGAQARIHLTATLAQRCQNFPTACAGGEMLLERARCALAECDIEKLSFPFIAACHRFKTPQSCLRAEWRLERTVPSGIPRTAATSPQVMSSTAQSKRTVRSLSGRRSISPRRKSR